MLATVVVAEVVLVLVVLTKPKILSNAYKDTNMNESDVSTWNTWTMTRGKRTAAMMVMTETVRVDAMRKNGVRLNGCETEQQYRQRWNTCKFLLGSC